MGVMYSVFPLQPELCAWLDEEGLAYPKEPSRNPRLSEIKAVIAANPRWQAELSDEQIGKRWSALLTMAEEAGRKPWCMLQIMELRPAENEFYFEKGDCCDEEYTGKHDNHRACPSQLGALSNNDI